MLSNTNRTIDLIGLSGYTYRFSLYSFDSFIDLKDAFKTNFSALYLFTRRSFGNENNSHDLVYLGETGDLSTRFESHHKEFCITRHGANCIGIYAASENERQRLAEENDLLANYDFPCNDINN